MKGRTNNPNGRPKGIPNKTTTDLRQWINNFIDDNRVQIKEDWQSLEPKDRIVLFEKLLKYSLPTLQATSLTTDFEKLTDENLDAIINQLKSVSHG
ncbi:MAG TPA: hypothetical protein VIL78_07180 [Hanamia sp.]